MHQQLLRIGSQTAAGTITAKIREIMQSLFALRFLCASTSGTFTLLTVILNSFHTCLPGINSGKDFLLICLPVRNRILFCNLGGKFVVVWNA